MFMISEPCKIRHAVSNKKKPIPGFTSRLMRAMVLLNDSVEILPLPQFARAWHDLFRFQFLESLRIGCVFIDRDDARSAGMSRGKRFREEAFGRSCISDGTEQKLQGASL